MPSKIRIRVQEGVEEQNFRSYFRNKLWREIQSGNYDWRNLLRFASSELIFTNALEEMKAEILREAADWAIEQQRKLEFWEGGKPGITEVV